MYKYLDKVLKKLVRQIYLVFQQYRNLPFDELNAFGEVQELYQELNAINLQAYREIMAYYYRRETGADFELLEVVLLEVLRTPSEVMKYAYDSEVTRKRDYLVEALLATSGSVAEFDKAMRYWVRFTGWFAVEVADAAVVAGREDMGIELVKWCSENDLRVCRECMRLDGQIFRLEGLPPKPHPNCRCWTIPLRGRVTV